MPDRKHEIWFTESFLDTLQLESFWIDRAEDWKRLQILDGNTLKPAMNQGFKGMPSPEEMERLHKLAEEGKLVFFKLANPNPFFVNEKDFRSVNINPVKPAALGKKTRNESQIEYDNKVTNHERLLKKYESDQKVLKERGEDFRAAIEGYNSSRNMKAEQTEAKIRNGNHKHVQYLHRLNDTDRFIDNIFGTKPTIVPGYFYQRYDLSNSEAVFQYSQFDEQLAPNAYDLPADSKLTEKEVATINFAMLGARESVEKFLTEELKFGPTNAKSEATNGFQMLVTGCFGQPRTSQPMASDGVLDMSLKLGKKAVEQYNQGSAELLGKNLADCVRNIKNVCAGYSWASLTQDTVAGARVIGRIQELFDKHDDIKQAANLNEKELEFMQGYVQLGKAYEHYLQNMVKFNKVTAEYEAQAAQGKKGKTQAENGKKAEKRVEPLTAKEKAEILADAVLRRLIEKDFAAEKKKRDDDPELQAALVEAALQDANDNVTCSNWKATLGQNIDADAIKRYQDVNNLLSHTLEISTRDLLDHEMVFMMAQKGMAERMRQNLMQNPAILAAAAKEPFAFTGKELEQSGKLDELVAQTEVIKDSWKTSEADKRAWFESMKSTLIGEHPENWINPNAKSDNERLMISFTRYDNEKKAFEVNMVGLEAILGDMKALENPSKETLDILHEQATRGNLYYYDVGKDMPVRVGVDGLQATTQQLEAPPKPTRWQIFANMITFGWAYADICNPKPDKDPAAFKAIMDGYGKRSAAAKNEAAQRSREIEAAMQQPAKEAGDQQKQNTAEINPNEMIGRKLSEYKKENIDNAMTRLANVKEEYLPAADKTKIALTAEEIGVLAAIVCGSKELSFISGSKGTTIHNDPDKYYNRIIRGHYADGGQRIGGAKTIDAVAHIQVKEALEGGDMNKLGQMLAEGLAYNNKQLAGMTELTDYYTIYAELGSKLLNIVNKDDQLKQAFEKHLGEKSNEVSTAEAAKNISDLRVKAMPIKEKLMVDFTKYKKSYVENVRDTPLVVSNNEEISTIGQLCRIQHLMKTKQFDLTTTEYKDSAMVDKLNKFMKSNEQLTKFRTSYDHREVLLDDVVQMAELYTDALISQKEIMQNNKKSKNVESKQNEINQNEVKQNQPQMGGTRV